MEKTTFVKQFKLVRSLKKNQEDIDTVIIKDFKMRLGRKPKVSFFSKKKQIRFGKCTLHYEFTREVEMGCLKFPAIISDWCKKHDDRMANWKGFKNSLN